MHEKKIGFSIELDETHLNKIEDVYKKLKSKINHRVVG